jgi:hypothetical protein
VKARLHDGLGVTISDAGDCFSALTSRCRACRRGHSDEVHVPKLFNMEKLQASIHLGEAVGKVGSRFGAVDAKNLVLWTGEVT